MTLTKEISDKELMVKGADILIGFHDRSFYN